MSKLDPEVRCWREVVRRATASLKRAERRADREKVIAKRLKEAKSQGFQPKHAGLMAAQATGLCKCGNAGCIICAVERQEKRKHTKAERREARAQEHSHE